MKKSKMILVSTVLAVSCLMSSCIGPFKVTKSMWAWNHGVGGKFVNELVFLALHIIPVYEVVYLADVLVFNTIDFWSGNGGYASNEQIIKGEKGSYRITAQQNGYTITNETEQVSVNLVFEEASKTWFVEGEKESAKLMTLIDDSRVMMYVGENTMEVELSEAGYMAFRQAVESASFFAAK